MRMKPPRIITVKVIPRASQNRLELQPDGSFVARVTAPPVEGEANRAVIQLLADYFGVAPSRIALVTGAKARLKRFQIK
ncbi:hypothetical protein HRbin15_00699 [bacterium HR15]|nr:hypothetical protein HRbin15_00699 [bacterium HR15]